MSFAQSEKWQSYLKASKSGRADLVAEGWLAGLSEQDFLGLVEICAASASPEEEFEAINLLFLADVSATFGEVDSAKLEPAFSQMASTLLSLARRQFSEGAGRTALLLLKRTHPEALIRFLIDEVNPANLNENRLKDVCSWLAESKSPEAIEHLKSMLRSEERRVGK